MTGAFARRHRRTAWAVGAAVLVTTALTVGWLLVRGAAGGAPSPTKSTPAPAVPSAPVAPVVTSPAAPAAPTSGRRVDGVVVLPSGQPCAGATVVVHRALSAWPEWQRERLETAFTGADGSFRFDVDRNADVLLEFTHPDWAGNLDEVPPQREHVVLAVQPGFGLEGVVTNDVGSPLPNARVAVESVLADQRRAVATTTSADGRFEFANLPAGPVRLVARHPQWQPAVLPAVVVGAQSRVDLMFDRPALPPLRGRVLAAVGQAPIAGATVEVLPPNGKPGLVVPAAATTGPDGTFVLPGLARGSAQAIVRHAEFGGIFPTLVVGSAATELVFELPPRSVVSGQLTLEGQVRADWAGQPLEIRDSTGELARAAVDEAGHFEFANRLSPGSATLQLIGGDLAFQRSLAAEVQVRVEERARTQLELPLAACTTVRGRVVDEQGRPLAGAAVVQTKLLAENARWIGDAAVSLDVGSFGSQVAQLVGYDRDLLLAVAGADGGFVVRGQKPGALLVRFELPGRGSRWQRVVVPSPGGVGEFGEVVLGPGCRVQGRVLRGELPLAGAAVSVVGRDSQTTVVTRRDGSFFADDLPPGDYRVRARLPSMPTANAEQQVTLAAGQPAVLSRPLVLPPGRIVRGSVVGGDGQPLAGALVTVRGFVGQPTVTDPGGRFSLELPQRSVELQASLGDRQSRVAVRTGQREIEIRLDTPPVCTLVAQVVGLPGRMRPPGALLRLATVEGGAETAPRTRWVEMPGGELRWPLCPVGRVRVQICCEGYAPWSGERDANANEPLQLGEVLLEPGCRLAGRVVDPAGKPVANAVVLLGEEADLDLFEPGVRSGADGAFRIAGVTTHSASLIVRAAGLAPRTVDLQLPRDVLAGTPLVVALEPGSTITVEAGRDTQEGALVQLRRQGRVLATAEIDDAGRAEFHNRSPGLYTVQVYGSDEPPRSVRVEGSGQRTVVRL